MLLATLIDASTPDANGDDGTSGGVAVGDMTSDGGTSQPRAIS
jgi:hypothetical protein